jgi:hypothetical protein
LGGGGKTTALRFDLSASAFAGGELEYREVFTGDNPLGIVYDGFRDMLSGDVTSRRAPWAVDSLWIDAKSSTSSIGS